MIPRVMEAIFRQLEERQLAGGGTAALSESSLRGSVALPDREVVLHVSYIEIYNEEVRDLLHPATSSKEIAIRERADGTILLAGVKEENGHTLTPAPPATCVARHRCWKACAQRGALRAVGRPGHYAGGDAAAAG